jgi:Ca2+-binding EF-hand superfamily protein
MMASRVTQTNPEQVIKEVFQVFDSDGKGYVTCENLCEVMKRLGEDVEEAKELFGAADVNGDGTIGFVSTFSFG